ncbi:aryl-sulfate sulfotransferase [Dyadobacter sp. MSC1_007]|jgi:arylsulfate sulfotransferase|uniref:aryl-sulfate sulfotransferase n=1 Tax=Dyadobacter sp. MSC1_007 TaxID=2909264 RepID=UPI002030DE2D|nr:aryl-sulfate sulfotransferase [Dyadobacter sp. MSC1_007]
MKCISLNFLFFLSWIFLTGCGGSGIETISLSAPGRNTLKVKIDVKTTHPNSLRISYWAKNDSLHKYITPNSPVGTEHPLVLTNLRPSSQYLYQIISTDGGVETRSKVYDFKTSGYPVWIQDFFRVIAPDTAAVPQSFKKGFVLFSRRETPGIIFMLDHKGNIRWYHQVNGTGFKTTHFTRNKTILSILGTEEYPTSYGNEILEVSMTGDTLLHLKKGEADFKETIHHEIILNDRDQIVTLNVQTKIMDLSSVGGSKQDTIKSDGIIVLDRKGKKVWSWSVFDVLDPLQDPKILQEKKDWMHANSVSFDNDGNYLMSFYNNGQIWKIDSKTGKVIWKFGRKGDFAMPSAGVFDQGHAVHRNSEGNLMLFDNGTSRETTRTLVFSLDEANKKSELKNHIVLPKKLYTARMGSAYMVGTDAVLHCSSKTNSIVLTNMEGRFLWMLKSMIMPYRAEFIPHEKVAPYLVN